MKYYLIAGEASGDLHGANLMKALRGRDSQAQFRVWGGDRMMAAGGELVKHYRNLAFMGFAEVVANLPIIWQNLQLARKDILQFQPDCLILIDYPGFNLRMARFAHRHKIPVVYYISPQVWAWKKSRVHTIKQVVDKMLLILPFEKDFYAGYGYPVDFVGHPLLDVITPGKRMTAVGTGSIALLPGSRRQEVGKMLPVMLRVAGRFPQERFLIAGMASLGEAFYRSYNLPGNVELRMDTAYGVLSEARAALVTSGTATLETALMGVPQIVCYRGSAVSFAIARRLVKLKYISLVNLILDRQAVPELIQHDLTPERLESELRRLLSDEACKNEMSANYSKLVDKLGGPGASMRSAEIITGFLEGSGYR